jgi:hypothetical protein
VEVEVEQLWRRNWQNGVTKTFKKEYEMNWSIVGRERWATVELTKEDGQPLLYKSAVKMFFAALKASDHMQFREIGTICSSL